MIVPAGASTRRLGHGRAVAMPAGIRDRTTVAPIRRPRESRMGCLLDSRGTFSFTKAGLLTGALSRRGCAPAIGFAFPAHEGPVTDPKIAADGRPSQRRDRPGITPGSPLRADPATFAGDGTRAARAATRRRCGAASLALRGAAGAWWPDSSSKRAGRGSPPPGRFDSYAAPFRRGPRPVACCLQTIGRKHRSRSLDGLRLLRGLLTLALWLAASGVALAAPGDLDPTFGAVGQGPGRSRQSRGDTLN